MSNDRGMDKKKVWLTHSLTHTQSQILYSLKKNKKDGNPAIDNIDELGEHCTK